MRLQRQRLTRWRSAWKKTPAEGLIGVPNGTHPGTSHIMLLADRAHARLFDIDGLPFSDGGPLAFQVLRGAVHLLRPGCASTNHPGRFLPFGTQSFPPSNNRLL
jgi:hypothetical protein